MENYKFAQGNKLWYLRKSFHNPNYEHFFLGCFVQFAVLQILEQPLCFVVHVVLGTPLQLDPVHLMLVALIV